MHGRRESCVAPGHGEIHDVDQGQGLLRIRNVDDDGRNEKEAPDNATTNDEDDHTEKETHR